MSEMTNHANHLLQFDGFLHWCVLIAVFVFLMGIAWVIVRVLLPLRRLAQQASSLMEGKLPAFDEPIRGIQEIEQLRRSLHHMIGQIKTAQDREMTYRNALTESQEHERMRIAREIHDDTIQSLVLVAHSLERGVRTAEMSRSPVGVHLKTARSQLILTIDNLRQMIADLRPTVLDELGLVVAIEMLCEAHDTLEFSVTGDVYSLDHTQELAIFRAAQEAIHNAERHAQAKRITAALHYSASGVRLEVCDDGQGFAIPQQLQEFASRGHYGLMGIRERILHLGGQLNLASEVTVGTRVNVTIPAVQIAVPTA